MSAASLLVLVRSTADLPRACAELSVLLALQRRHGAAAQEALLGLWVDPRGVARIPPGELRWRTRDGRRGAACIVETAGVEGIWMLCRMEVPEASPALSRNALLRSLATAFERVDTDPLPAFFPVFRVDARASEVRAEARRLETEHADLVRPPLFQDPSSGWIESSTVHPARGMEFEGGMPIPLAVATTATTRNDLLRQRNQGPAGGKVLMPHMASIGAAQPSSAADAHKAGSPARRRCHAKSTRTD